MAELLTRDTCTHHPDRIADASCDHCGDPMCAACSIEAVAAAEEYCSRECADAVEANAFTRFAEGLDSPFSIGIRLWWHSIGPLLAAIWPLAALVALAVWLDDPTIAAADGSEPSSSGWGALVLVGIGAYGMLVIGTVLSQQYTNLIRGNVHIWAASRIVPWALTWLLLFVAVALGYLLLIIPGIFVGLRLFWADEFSLAHRADPWGALKESWALTEGEALAILGFQFLTGLVMWLVLLIGVGVAAASMMVLAAMGSLGFLVAWVVFAVILSLCYALLHSVELVKFYGMRAVHLRGRTSDSPVELGLTAK